MRCPRPSAGACAALALALMVSRPAGGAPDTIPLTLPSGKVLQTELMLSDEQRALGLMFRDSLASERALLFVFGRAGFHGIWMKNCRFPIDIVWLDDAARVVHLAEAVPPCSADPCPVYEPLRKASYVLELNAGLARREKALVGSRLDFTLPR